MVTQFAWSAGAQVQTAGMYVAEAYIPASNQLVVLFNNVTATSAAPAAGFYGLIIA
jgi:hypothetical protein